MKPIKYFLIAVWLVPTILWLFADTLMPQPFTYFAFRDVFIQYSGVLAIVVMSVAVLLAVRPKSLEWCFRGLDKMYRLHKWLGISALVITILHWWFAQGTKWMVAWGWLEKHRRRHRGGGNSLEGLEAWFHSHRGLAESMGEWAFYAALVLIVLALWKRFPYHWFAKTHKLLALAYLVLAFHALVLSKFTYWSQPVGWLIAPLLLMGSLAALWLLTGKVGARRKYKGEIQGLEYHEEMGVLEVTVRMQDNWPGHRAGQFAFAMSDHHEGAHPYTIASAWDPTTRQITFIIKGLGDHTCRLNEWLKTGMQITVEGPYGCFDFNDDQPRQIWIGAGIGITPFIARMKRLAKVADGKQIDFFHPTSQINQVIRDKLAADVAASGVDLHLMVEDQDGRLDGERIRSTVPDWQSASIWFCGPPAFGEALRDDFIRHGLPPEQFHHELFNFR